MDKLNEHLRSSNLSTIQENHVISGGGHTENLNRIPLTSPSYNEIPSGMGHHNSLITPHSLYQLPHTTMINQWQYNSIIPHDNFMAQYQPSLHHQHQSSSICETQTTSTVGSTSQSYTFPQQNSLVANLSLNSHKKEEKSQTRFAYSNLRSEFNILKKENSTNFNTSLPNSCSSSIKKEILNDSGDSKNNSSQGFFTNETIIRTLPEKECPKVLSTKICLMCQASVNLDSEQDWKDSKSGFTSSSFTIVYDAVKKIVNEMSINAKVRKTSIICGTCFALLDLTDDLQEQINELNIQLKVSFI